VSVAVGTMPAAVQKGLVAAGMEQAVVAEKALATALSVAGKLLVAAKTVLATPLCIPALSGVTAVRLASGVQVLRVSNQDCLKERVNFPKLDYFAFPNLDSLRPGFYQAM
jgi:hypothetical protein